jgi:hypothetical protein
MPWAISSAVPFAAITRTARSSSSLPWVWSPLEWVISASVIGARSVIGAIASNISRVNGKSNRVSTNNDDPSPTTRPALLQPNPPSGNIHAHTRSAT